LDVTQLVYAAILGVLQGLTEFLPVSSTAHLLVGEQLMHFDDPGHAFAAMIQLGSILAVMWLYRQRIIDVITGLPSKPEARRFALMLIVAFLPVIPIGYFGKHFVKDYLQNSAMIIGWALLIGGVVMLVVERFRPKPSVEDASQTPMWRAFMVGMFQCVALIPGISRSGATIYGGMLSGLDRRAAAEFSFFLAMPTMAAVFASDFFDIKDHLTSDRALTIGVGFVFAFISSLLVVKPFLNYVTAKGFMPFAGYRIVAGAAVLGLLAMGYLH